jgi:hypothetical protein
VLADADSNAGIGPITDVFNILGEVGRKRLRPFFLWLLLKHAFLNNLMCTTAVNGSSVICSEKNRQLFFLVQES